MTTETLISNFNNQIIAPLILLLFTLSLVMFFWGVVDFIRGSDNEEARRTGRNHMIWGIIGIFIMVSAWGIILMVTNTFGVTTQTLPAGLF